jgi:hypothetical protein
MNFGSGFLAMDAAVEHPLSASALAAVEMNSRLLIAILPLFYSYWYLKNYQNYIKMFL